MLAFDCAQADNVYTTRCVLLHFQLKIEVHIITTRARRTIFSTGLVA